MSPRALRAFAAALLLSASSLPTRSQTSAAPIPPEIRAAHTLFLSFAGDDEFPEGSHARELPGDLYARLYSALARWGQLQLEPSPSSADLVLEVRASLSGADHTSPAFQSRRLDYTLCDRATHVALWGGRIHVEEAARSHGLDSKLEGAIAALIADLQRLHTAPSSQP